MKKINLLAMVFLICSSAVAQNSKRLDRKLMPYAGVIFQKSFFGEAGIMYCKVETMPKTGRLLGLGGWRLGMESNFDKNQIACAPKVGYNFEPFILCARISVLSYLGNGKADLRVLPEIGYTIFGKVSLAYGRNIALLSYRNPAVCNNRLSLFFNLHSCAWKH